MRYFYLLMVFLSSYLTASSAMNAWTTHNSHQAALWGACTVMWFVNLILYFKMSIKERQSYYRG